MTEISSLSSPQRLTSQPKISLESSQKLSPMQPSAESQKMEQLFQGMEQIEHAFALTKEIRLALESALNQLSQD